MDMQQKEQAPITIPQIAEEGFEKITAPLQFHFAELVKRVNGTWVDYQPILDKLGKTYTAYTYAGVNHGFHNDSTARYSEAEAELAWERTMAFFAEHLKG